MLEAARTVTAAVRQAILAAEEARTLPELDLAAFVNRLKQQVETQTKPSLIPVINATGVVSY